MGGIMYKLEELLYLYQDLEPFIDTHTMGLHYNKHAKNYLNNLNGLLKKNRYDYRYNLNELVFHINMFPLEDRENILFNLGGVINHNLYFKSMNKNEKRQLPSNNLLEKINEIFGGFDEFYALFKEKALTLKGSGYTFLVINKNKELEIINVKNQDLPILMGYIPLLNIDMWEHAYYLNYKNNKSEYIDNFKEIIDFTYANNLYENFLKRV